MIPSVLSLMKGIGSCSTNYYSDLDSVLPFDNRTTSLGQRCPGNSSRVILAFIWKVGRYIRSETCPLGLPYVPCRWGHRLRGKPPYVTIRQRLFLIVDMFSISAGQCRASHVQDLYPQGLAFSRRCISPVDAKIVCFLHSVQLNH